MDSRQALRHIVDMSGKSQRSISTETGRAATFLSAMFTAGRAPGTDLMAELAHACGYKLYLEGHDERIEIDGRGAVEEG